MQIDNPRLRETIDAIRSAFRNDSAQNDGVNKTDVMRWMASPYLEVQGALYSKLSNPELAGYVRPGLNVLDYYNFVVPYLERCIRENPQSEWSDSRYLAGHQLVRWILEFWNSKDVPRNRMVDVKNRLADLYKQGDDSVRDAVINAVLEHLFENRDMVRYFKDWELDPILSRPYGDALLWMEKKPPMG